MKKWHIILPIIVIYFLLLFYTCYKPKETSEVKEPHKQEKAAEVQPAPEPQKSAPVQSKQTELSELQAFEGCLDSRELPQDKALEYLSILLKGNSDSIEFYKAYQGYQQGRLENNLMPVYSPALERTELYQKDICIALNALSGQRSTEAYELIVEIIKQKAAYPKARSCAARALIRYGEMKDSKWHGDRRSISVLSKILNDNDPDVRLQAAGTLLSLGESDIALPILQELTASERNMSIAAFGKLFAFEEKEENGEKEIEVSNTKLWDEKGRDILLEGLDHSDNVVRAFTALKLAQIGIETQRVEEVSLEILGQLKFKKRRDYSDIDKRESDRASGLYTIDALKEIKSTSLIDVLNTLIKNSDDPYLIIRARQALGATGSE